MTMKNQMTNDKKFVKQKVYFDTPLTFTKAKDDDDDEDVLIIEGYASTKDVDRTSDVIEASAWKKRKALNGYKKNPIILAFHRHDKPIGTAETVEAGEDGLHIRARISKAAGDVYSLIKEGILKTFSVGIIVNDMSYNEEKDVFLLKDIELLEVSVVSVPANPYATFRIGKSFENNNEFEEFKNSFKNINTEENQMLDNKETNSSAPIFDMAALTESIVKAISEKEAAEKAAKETEAKKTEAYVSDVKTAAERLVADVEKRFEEKGVDLSKALEELRGEVKTREEEIMELKRAQKSKMHYSEGGAGRDNLTDQEKDIAILLSKALRRPMHELKYFNNLKTKSGMEHWDSGVQSAWEEEFSTRVHNEMRQTLIVEPIFSSFPMNTPTMYMPVNPEAGEAEWVQDNVSPNTQNFLRSSLNTAQEAPTTGEYSSTGSAVDHELTENVIRAYKLASKEYIGYEEEEDSIVPLMPIIRDALARRMSKSADKAVLRGAGVDGDPIKGLTGLGASVTDITYSVGATGFAGIGGVAITDFNQARKNLGIYGLDPSALVWIVSHELYYAMMEFDQFLTLDKIGTRATLLTGQVGSIFGTPVVVSQQFDNANITTPANGATLGVLCRPANFIKGELRGMRVESDRDVINQKNALVATRRFGFKDLDVGQGVVKLGYVT